MIILKNNKVFFVNEFYVKLNIYSSVLVYDFNLFSCNILNNFKKILKINRFNVVFLKNNLSKKIFIKFFLNSYVNFLNKSLFYVFSFDLFDCFNLVKSFNFNSLILKLFIYDKKFLFGDKLIYINNFYNRSYLINKLLVFFKNFIFNFFYFLKILSYKLILI